MAKYDVIYFCGHTGVLELLGKSKEREWTLEQAKKSLCPQCWHKQKLEEDKAKGLILQVKVMPFLVDTPVILAFDGDTITNKEKIKELGYTWGDCQKDGGTLDILRTTSNMQWHKYIAIDQLDEEMNKAVAINAKIENRIQQADIVSLKKLKEMNDIEKEKTKETEDKINKEIAVLVKPVRPTILEEKPWNKKIYGKSGNHSVYLYGEKKEISNEQADELNKYVEDLEIYKENIKEIKRGKVNE